MNVFCDRHHGDLTYSLQLLFEKRLGWNIYFPIGMDWFYKGFWDIGNPYPNPADTAKQYLGTDDRTWDAYKNLNADYKIEDGIYHVYDPVHRCHIKCITFEKFCELPIDIVISSYPFGHDQTYARLISEYKPQAKQIAQMGNIYQQTEVKNVMCSTLPYPTDKHIVFYHQEFNLDVFRYEKPQNFRKITSFINLLPRVDLYEWAKLNLPDFEFKAYGASTPDGTISSDIGIADIMRQSTFGWHIKPKGDGFGHVIHNWYACGRPIITDIFDYQDKLAGQLLTDELTCIDIHGKSNEQILDRIKHFSQPRENHWMSFNAYNRFRCVVDYDKEFEDIKHFLENLV
jgi:hypothetical protein